MTPSQKGEPQWQEIRFAAWTSTKSRRSPKRNTAAKRTTHVRPTEAQFEKLLIFLVADNIPGPSAYKSRFNCYHQLVIINLALLMGGLTPAEVSQHHRMVDNL